MNDPREFAQLISESFQKDCHYVCHVRVYERNREWRVYFIHPRTDTIVGSPLKFDPVIQEYSIDVKVIANIMRNRIQQIEGDELNEWYEKHEVHNRIKAAYDHHPKPYPDPH